MLLTKLLRIGLIGAISVEQPMCDTTKLTHKAGLQASDPLGGIAKFLLLLPVSNSAVLESRRANDIDACMYNASDRLFECVP